MPIDYTKFLSKPSPERERMRLPYLGGSSVFAPSRRLRVTRRVSSGWWVFEVEGRNAEPVEALHFPDADVMSARPRVLGHAVGDWLFVAGTQAHRLYLRPTEEEIPEFTPVAARRWPDGSHIYEEQRFDDEPEMAVREAYIERATDLRDLGVKGVTPSLKAAFGFACVQRSAQIRDVPVSAIEMLNRLHEVATGTVSAEYLLDHLEARRHQALPLAHPRREQHRARRRERDVTPEARAQRVLEAADAELLHTRRVNEVSMEVMFRYLGEQFVAVVDQHTLHVYDSGICLDGADEELGLDALPVVIREAMHTGQIVITSRWRMG